MGGKHSKPEFSRQKTLLRRSTQRSLFLTAKRELAYVNRKIEKLPLTASEINYTELRARLDEIEKELDSITDLLKNKNRKSYERRRRCLQETYVKLEHKFQKETSKMGGNQSKSEFSRRKSLLRRSTQRSLFLTAKRDLAFVNRKMDKLPLTATENNYTDLRAQLDEIQKELDSVSDLLKEKHRKSYEDCRKYLQETYDKLEHKFRKELPKTPPAVDDDDGLTDAAELEDQKKVIGNSSKVKPKLHLNLLKVLPTPENSETKENPLRSPKTPPEVLRRVEEPEQTTTSDEDHRVSIASRFSKLGIQVLPPVLPNTKLTMMLESKRNQSNESISPPQSPQIDLVKREKFRPAAPGVPQTPSFDSQPSTPSFVRKSDSISGDTKHLSLERTNSSLSPLVITKKSVVNDTTESNEEEKNIEISVKETHGTKHLSLERTNSSLSPLVIPKKPIVNFNTESNKEETNIEISVEETDGYKIITDSQEYTDHLENQLKLFKGNREDPAYFYLQEGFFRNLMKLDTIIEDEDAVLKQEKKLAIKRIEELVKKLEMKVTASLNNVAPADSSDDDVFDEYESSDKQDDFLNTNGKSAIITHL